MHFAECGAMVVAVDINREQLDEIAAPRIEPFVADVSRGAECAAVAKRAAELGPITGLLNSAGIELHGSVIDMPEEAWDRVMNVNLKAIFLLSKHVIPHMIENGSGSVVNMSSVQALATQAGVAAYAATKGAVLSLTRVMALDHGKHNIRVTAICPGTIDTPLARANAQHWNPDNPHAVLAEWGSKHALNRIGQPVEVARLAAFLLSEELQLHYRLAPPGRWWIAGLILTFLGNEERPIMRRSEINRLQNEALEIFAEHRFNLPLFGRWTPADWIAQPAAARYCLTHQMGWDVTDFGSSRFEERGLVIFCVRNGLQAVPDEKPYAEKLLVVRENQETPLHAHKIKMEDIIVRGGGALMIELHNMGETGGLDTTPVHVMVDGVEHLLEGGEPLRLAPGQSATITRNLWHRFYGEIGGGTVFVGEVSQVNDDFSDNNFLETIGRFAKIEEDEPILYPLWNELASLDRKLS